MDAVPNEFIHEPWRMPVPPADYPAPAGPEGCHNAMFTSTVPSRRRPRRCGCLDKHGSRAPNWRARAKSRSIKKAPTQNGSLQLSLTCER
jgi:hypothetical protein